MNQSRYARGRLFQTRLYRWGCIACLAIPSSLWGETRPAVGQSTALPPPVFRPRTDAMAAQDADALREQLKRVIDSRGPINPLSEYVQSPAGTRSGVSTSPQAAEKSSAKSMQSGANDVDEEAERIPSLDLEAQKRLKANPPSVHASDLGFVQILPPARVSASGSVVVVDDGFRPVVASSDVLPTIAGVSGAATVGTVELPWSSGWRVVANLPQNDPGAAIPPSLGGLPPYSSVPSAVPSVTSPPPALPSASIPMSGSPTFGSPPAGTSYPPPGYPAPGYPAPGYPAPGVAPGTMVPGGIVPGTIGPSTVAPASIVPGQMVPSSAVPGSIPPATAASTAAPVLTYPAPPSYVVPNPIAAPPTGVYPPNSAMGAGSPYASGPLPSYARTSSWVNSAPFVSPPPASMDAKWMVSPAVYRQAMGSDCGPMQPAGATVPLGQSNPGVSANPMAPGAVVPAPGGTVGYGPGGLVPSSGLTPVPTASPFVYTPMAAMPPPTVYAAGNGGYTPLVGFGQGTNAQLGRGMWGQPTAYVEGQKFKNFLRYISP